MLIVRWSGRLLGLALIIVGMVIGWFGIAEMMFEKPSMLFWRFVLPGVALIAAGVLVEEAAWVRGPSRR